MSRAVGQLLRECSVNRKHTSFGVMRSRSNRTFPTVIMLVTNIVILRSQVRVLPPRQNQDAIKNVYVVYRQDVCLHRACLQPRQQWPTWKIGLFSNCLLLCLTLVY